MSSCSCSVRRQARADAEAVARRALDGAGRAHAHRRHRHPHLGQFRHRRVSHVMANASKRCWPMPMRRCTAPSSAATACSISRPNMGGTAQYRLRLESDLHQALKAGAVRTALPAEGRHGQRRRAQRRGAAALAPSRARLYSAGRVHPRRRGDRPDWRDRRLGAAAGLPAGPRLARSGQCRHCAWP